MSRRISALVALVVLAIGLGASACSNAATGPAPVRADLTCDWASNPTCHH
jgi:hypothetical protein